MNQDEFCHIDNLISEIQNKQNWEPGRDLSQRDFEFLIESVFIETKTSISLSTIKRIWYHENKYLPRVSTLDILCQYVGYSNWSHYKVGALEQVPESKFTIDFSQKNNKKFWRIAWMSIGGIVVVLSMIYFGRNLFEKKLNSLEDVRFSLDKIVGDDIPVTVVFSYDISKLEFDSAFIQLSWNILERFKISSPEHILTSTYYIPGIHEAKLIINDSIVQTQAVYIENNRWLTMFRSTPEDVVPIYIESEKVYHDGYIQANTGLLAEFLADTSRESYYVSYIRSQDFNINADDFSFSTRFKNPSTKGKFNCQSSSLYIYTENGGIFLTFNKSGCVGNTAIVVGDQVVSGRRNDLSALGRDFSEWQDVKGVVNDKSFTLFINDTIAYETQYKEEMGKILTWQYFFLGTGAVDDLVLKDGNGTVIFKDDF